MNQKNPDRVNHNRWTAMNAAREILVERDITHGKASTGFGISAQMWSAYLGVEITPSQVCDMMALNKFARVANAQEPNPDNPIDIINYASLSLELNNVPMTTSIEQDYIDETETQKF